jgi:hypothetical protein
MEKENFTQQFWWRISLAGLGLAAGAWLLLFLLG